MSSAGSLFFEGDLQAGISLAISHDKITVCFVAGNNDESSLWENSFLRDDEIAAALAAKSVTLRIEEESIEASYLSAYYPISTAPTVILITICGGLYAGYEMVVNQGFSQGQLLLELKSGSSKDQFKDSILNALNTSSTQSSSSSTTRSVPPSETPDVSATLSSPHGADSPSPSGTDLNQSMERTPSALPALPQPSSAVQDLLQDRRIRLEADKKEKEAAEKADRKAKAEAQRESQIADDPAKANQVSYAQQRRKRLYEEKLERERIMRAIQDDKNARKERENRRKALMMEEVEGNDGANGLVSGQLLKEFGNANESSRKECALQVRLFDGSTIRRKFPPNESLRNHVRAWIEEEGSDGDMPFTLKQILTPLPNRTISISQEEESLHSLGLMPSATLVKVPVQGYTTAYVADQGVISRGISAGYNIASAGVSKITGLMGTVLGLAQAIPQEENSTPQVRREANRAAPGVNIGSLRDQGEDRYEHQLYNGNQLNFEPRRDDEET